MSADVHHDDGHPHGTLKSYLIGFGLSVVLTAIPFWLVMAHVFDSNALTTVAVLAFAVVQMIVHMIFFLHMNGKAEGGWQMMSAMFTILLVVITLSGSIWVMYNMTRNMMPASAQDMRQMP